MKPVAIYGIKNCDTMKKAMTWLADHDIPYDFHDYKKQGFDAAVTRKAIAQHGWETVINKRGTTWRALPDDMKNSADDASAVAIAEATPSVLKRPLLVIGDETHIGFNPAMYESIFADD